MPDRQAAFRRAPFQQAFTLGETLLAVVILAILLAVAMPTLGRLRTQAMDVKCQSNLRFTGMALIQYAADHDGRFLPTKFWYSRLSTAASPGIRDYLGSSSTAKSTSAVYKVDSVLTCPQLKADCPDKFPNMLNRCYSMNQTVVANDPSYPDVPEAGENPGSFQRLVNLPDPARMWIFTDGGTTDPDGPGEFATIVSPSSVKNLLYPHRSHQNVVFFDGHLERLSSAAFNAPPDKRAFWGDRRME
ncbi:MAG TPA: hypothetical protein VNQ90_10895 [Chthoniobacteraceae bacterium]|nr:hypothetical protein [Chthoniobacteraceae bacterium]